MSGTFSLPRTLTPGAAEDVRDVQTNFEAVRDRLNDGFVDQPKPAAAATGTEVVGTGGSGADLNFATEVFDTGAMFTAGENKITAVTAGIYLVTACVETTTTGAGNLRGEIRQYRGASLILDATQDAEAASGVAVGVNLAMVCKAEAGDIFQLIGIHSFGVDHTLEGKLQAVRLSPAA